MAGSYPDMPANRMATHLDGTIGWIAENAGPINQNSSFHEEMNPETILELTPTVMSYLNDDDDNTRLATDASQPNRNWPHQPDTGSTYFGNPYPDGWSMAFVFPEHRDLYGVFPWMHASGGNNSPAASPLCALQWSANTTNGVDGTWNDIIAGPNFTYNDWATDYSGSLYYRQLVQGFSGPQARGIRIGLYLPYAGIFNTGCWSQWSMFHVYGNINDDLVTERLVWIDEATGLEFDNLVDWGDVPRGTSLTKEVRLKNLSPTYAATSVDIDFDAIPSPGNSDWYSIKDYGGGYTNGFTITSISAGATYPAAGPMTIKLTLPADAELSMDTSWLSAGPPTWV